MSVLKAHRSESKAEFVNTANKIYVQTISWTMLLMVIILAVPLERFGAELPWDMPLMAQAVICGIAITAVEFVAGLIINVWLGMGVWDYSNMPGNIMGQICPQFLFMWIALAAVGIVMLDWIRYTIEGGERPHYTLFRKRKAV